MTQTSPSSPAPAPAGRSDGPRTLGPATGRDPDRLTVADNLDKLARVLDMATAAIERIADDLRQPAPTDSNE